MIGRILKQSEWSGGISEEAEELWGRMEKTLGKKNEFKPISNINTDKLEKIKIFEKFKEELINENKEGLSSETGDSLGQEISEFSIRKK